jgi:hypothetical protein
MRFPVAALIFGGSALILGAGSASAQAVISAHSGTVQYVEGRALLDNQVVDPKFGQFPDIKENQEFRTEEGRAEILLTPGVFLRLGENSSIRMVSNRLTDTRVELLSGSAVVECNDVPKDNSIQAIFKANSIRFEKQGLYRIDAQPAQLRVYQGEAIVTDGSGQLTVKGGKSANLDGALQADNFDRKDTDSLYNWSDRRAAYVAQANLVSASTVSGNSGYGGYSGYGLGGLGFGGLGYSAYGVGYDPSFLGGWSFNPLFGMYTWLPYSGFGFSPFGYMYYSPYTVGYAPFYGTGPGGYTASRVSRVAGIAGTDRLASISRSGSGLSALGRSSFTSSARAGLAGGGGGFSGGGHASASMGGGGGHAGGGGGHR